MTKKLKKVDFRMDEELYNKLLYITDSKGVKKSSWCRRAVKIRVDDIFENDGVEEDYESWKRENENKRDTKINS